MNIMNMPGYTAEASLLSPRVGYYSSGGFYTEINSAILPQEKKKEGQEIKIGKCKARCDGTHAADTRGCSVANDPYICMSIADNKLSRCKMGCDMLGIYGSLGNQFDPTQGVYMSLR